MRAMLVDDEEMALDVLEILCKEIGGVTVIGKYRNPFDAVEAVQTQEVDVVFLDVEMPGINGLQTAEKMMRLDDHVHIVFVTAYNQYAVEAFEINAIDYLLKPVRKERLKKTIERLHHTRIVQTGLHKEKESHQARVCCLGTFVLYDKDGQQVKWRTRKTKELFAYLWHHRGQAVHRDKIMVDLWSDLEGEKASSLLHTSMYHLRSTLKKMRFAKPVLFSDEKYALNVQELVSDVEEIEQRIKESIENVSDASLEMMLTTYKGDYMGEEAFHWASGYRKQVREMYSSWLDANTKRCQDKKTKERLLYQLVIMEPYRDEYCYRLMNHYISAGDIPQALSVYHDFEKLLARELREEPGPKIRDLYIQASRFL
ncbi:two-component SAPR family response regulator [Aneurinibacillus soli]|uniref:Transcriptional regulatory protein YehT n=1 Tax=Aneurinibacillus soli TaxID=1500254 RepID=A0A0U5BEF8_9BACL|nr:response regulator [Aneurinibacillus soli]PYE62181.1 two-component SAPR family response regulator [Aneurinibacillus soli]BAU28631.1 Transcriptional regulatory protein YehT [Aneurinibacillus soli]